jgi:hypothetical protein
LKKKDKTPKFVKLEKLMTRKEVEDWLNCVTGWEGEDDDDYFWDGTPIEDLIGHYAEVEPADEVPKDAKKGIIKPVVMIDWEDRVFIERMPGWKKGKYAWVPEKVYSKIEKEIEDEEEEEEEW